MEPGEQDEAEETLWRRVVDTLLSRGATPTEAIDGANLVLQAYRRRREREPEGSTAESGMRRLDLVDEPSSRRAG